MALKEPTAEASTIRASGAQLRALDQLLLSKTLDSSSSFMHTPDLVGAFVIHALMVGNSDESLALCWKILQANPELLNQVHVRHRAGIPLFTGESCLHIAAVNHRGWILCSMIALARQSLTPSDLENLLRSQATGVFFEAMPMRFYGGTPLAYACCFEQRDAVTAMLATGIVSLNDPRDACAISGYLPLHAVTANGLTSMYEWLTKALPENQRADELQLVSVGRMVQLGVHSLTPLQVRIV